MKANIHPTYLTDVKVVCACGNTFITGSTKQNITVDVCNKCHPFYTGEHRFLDTKGRVDVFQKKQKMAQEFKEKYVSKKARKEEKSEKKTKSLRELLGEV